MKYIECRHTALVKCKLNDGQVVEFYPYVLNKYTGVADHTGFTAVDEQLLTRLSEESKVFIGFKKSKLLIVRDTLPQSAQTPFEILNAKDLEIAKLHKELAEVRTKLDEALRPVKEPPKEEAKEEETVPPKSKK